VTRRLAAPVTAPIYAAIVTVPAVTGVSTTVEFLLQAGTRTTLLLDVFQQMETPGNGLPAGSSTSAVAVTDAPTTTEVTEAVPELKLTRIVDGATAALAREDGVSSLGADGSETVGDSGAHAVTAATRSDALRRVVREMPTSRRRMIDAPKQVPWSPRSIAGSAGT
jgi:hypothetical protein